MEAPQEKLPEVDEKAIEPAVVADDESSVSARKDLLADDTELVLARKMKLVNDAIDELGWTTLQTKLFILNGFGYGVDSLLFLVPGIVKEQVKLEYPPPGFPEGSTMGFYVGLLFGALFWGFYSDTFGRKFAFNASLFICAIWTTVTAGANSYVLVAVFNAFMAAGCGGNLILDTTIFLENLPSYHQWTLTLLACTWGMGQLIAGLIAWIFSSDGLNCNYIAENCTKERNMGWRWTYLTTGLFVLVLAVLRVTVIRFHETPKYCIGAGRDEEAVQTLRYYADRAGRPISLTVEQLKACGELDPAAVRRRSRFTVAGLTDHVRGLFVSRRLALSTALVFLSWFLMGISYGLYTIFLPYYLRSRGNAAGDGSTYTTYRDYALANTATIFGPVAAAGLCRLPRIGRRGTIGIGALMTMAFLFAYTGVRTAAANVGLNVAISFTLNLAYGCLYAYTPEVMPSQHRATGNAIAVACNRFAGVISTLVNVYGDVTTSTPLYVCAAMMGSLALVATLLPFEPNGKRAS